MFKEMFDFSKVRTAKEAVGFYLTHLLIVILVAFLVELVFLLPGRTNAVSYASLVAELITGVWSLVLSLLILRGHGLMSKVGYVLSAIIAGMLGLIGFGLLGLMIPAYFTTRPSLLGKHSAK